MHPLTLDDLLPLEEYVPRRGEFLQSLNRYLDRHRRVRVGPSITLLFENRQTLWFRLQEVLRVARISEPGLVQGELDLYNRLLPGPDQLQAALLIAIADEARALESLSTWQGLRGEHVRFRLADRTCHAHIITCRPEDRAIGMAHWVQFTLDEAAKQALADGRQPAWLEIGLDHYKHESGLLSDDVRQSLLEDLRVGTHAA